MNNHHAWEHEYQNPQFLTLGTEPLGDIRDFMKWVKKQVRKNPQDFSGLPDLSDWNVLDLGCGNGKNLKYIVQNFCAQGIGYDISKTAITIAQKLAQADNIQNETIHYEVRSISDTYPISENSIDLVLDITSSNALTSIERNSYISEIVRVLKPGGLLCLRTLCLTGDSNAKNLLKNFPGSESNRYVLGDTGIEESVFTENELREIYEPYFNILYIEKTSGYQKWNNQSYKRNYWVVYMQRK